MYPQNMSSSSNLTNQRVAVVTGSSTGIGFEIALALARNGFLTYATMRNLSKRDRIQSIANEEKLPIRLTQLDVTDDDSVKNAINSILSEVGRIDILVNNAGFGVIGPFEDVAIDEIKKQHETNFYGVIRVTQAVLPNMRRQKSGRIINISSGAGRFGYPGGSAYVSSKFALEGLSECMTFELEQFGIKVVLVEPGFIKTNFSNSIVFAKKAQDQSSPYAKVMQEMQSTFSELAGRAAPAALVAEKVVEAATSDNPKLRYLAGKDVEEWVAAKKSMSDEEFYAMMKRT
jgi:NAD(P)-dependent dehydrogenase (short-subunit alcohol dehydrogenase family)